MEIADADKYRRFMQWIGIERVVITQGNAHQFDNRNLVACLKKLGRRALRSSSRSNCWVFPPCNLPVPQHERRYDDHH